MILANLATALFEHGRITTTETKARVLRPVAEKLITKARKGDLHNRREVLKTIRDKSVVHTLFTEIAPTFAERPGGYTRITKLGPRKGDNAPMAVIELVTEAYTPSAPKQRRPGDPGRRAGGSRTGRRGRAACRGRPRRGGGDRRVGRDRGRRDRGRGRGDRRGPERGRSQPDRRAPSCRSGREARGRQRPDTHATRSHGASEISVRRVGVLPAFSDSLWAHRGPRAARWVCTRGTTLAPSPDAAATRFIDPDLMSPTAKIPGTTVARFAGGSPSDHRSLGTSRPVSTKPCSSRQISVGSQSHFGSAPSSRNRPAASCRVTSSVFRSRMPTHSRRPSPPPSTTSAHSRMLILGTYFISRSR